MLDVDRRASNESMLVHRILNAIPAASYAMNALLSLLRVEVTDAVATAAVTCERRPVLRVNPDFVDRHCRTDEHLFMLVMHELHHILLGHTRLFLRPTPAHNVAFDAVINALLCAQFPARAYTSFFLDLYGDQTGVLRLLAPPDARRVESPVLERVHGLLYGHGQVTSEEIFDAIVREVLENLAADLLGDGPPLLGNHGRDGDWGTDGPLDPDLVRAIRAVVEKWPPPDDPIRGRSLADVLKDEQVAGRGPGWLTLQATRRALTAAATRGGGVTTRGLGPVPSRVVLPNPRDRRGVVTRALGGRPLIYDATLLAPKARHLGKAYVYLDVSGSMDPYLPWLYGALSALRAHVAAPVQLFSTAVRPVGLAELTAGRVCTTGGTDIACVVDDAVDRKAGKVLVITDGYVGPVGAEGCRRLRRAGVDLRVLLTPDGWRDDLSPAASRIDELPRLEG